MENNKENRSRVKKSNYEILDIIDKHENITDKDFTCAFIVVYQNMNILLANRYFVSEVDDSLIMQAIAASLLNFEEDQQNQKLHFLLSLVYKCKIKKGNDTFTLISKKSLTNFHLFEIMEIAVARINAVREDDGFLAFIRNSVVKKYESMDAIVKELYNSDQETFKSLLLDLGIVKDKQLLD